MQLQNSLHSLPTVKFASKSSENNDISQGDAKGILKGLGIAAAGMGTMSTAQPLVETKALQGLPKPAPDIIGASGYLLGLTLVVAGLFKIVNIVNKSSTDPK